MAEYLTNTTDLTKVASAIRAKGGTSDPLIYPDGFVTAIESIQAGGGANELLEWFGGSKYYTTTVTPTSNTEQILITPDDATILDSPKFLLIIPDIPAARNVVRTRAIARAPSADSHVSAVIVSSIGQVYVCARVYVDASSGNSTFNITDSNINGDHAFDRAPGITISGGTTLSVHTYSSAYTFKGGQPYKVLLIG